MKKLLTALTTVLIAVISTAMTSTPSWAAGHVWVPDDYDSRELGARRVTTVEDPSFCPILSAYRDEAGRSVVPAKAVKIFPRGGDSLAPECRNVYTVLGRSGRCDDLTVEGRQRVASEFYTVGHRFLSAPGSKARATYISTGPDVRFVMGCLRSSRSEAGFIDCLDLHSEPVAVTLGGKYCPR